MLAFVTGREHGRDSLGRAARATVSASRGMGLALVVVSAAVCVAARLSPAPRVHRDVSTLQGVVRGYLAPDPPHFAYFGMPYARPPTLRDRFKAPRPPPKWDGIFEATHKVKCSQGRADGEDNCLVVNVFSPEQGNSLPVIVFVHDGDFQNGWGAYYTPTMFLSEDFVVVTFNYRLGALGFLCLNITEAPGNAGLKDQVAAIYWVYRNIAVFGGNPRAITVHGSGASAAAIQLLLLSGLVDGLLHKVIMEAGSVLSPPFMTYDPLSLAYEAAISLGYEGPVDSEELYQFYQNTPTKDLSSVTVKFLPCVDNEGDSVYSLVDTDPMQRFTEGKFYNVPMLITYTQKDKESILGEDKEKFDIIPKSFEELLPNNLEFDNLNIQQGVADIVKNFYFSQDFTQANIPQSYADYIHDTLTEYPIIKMAMLFAFKNKYPVYVTRFTLPVVDTETSAEATRPDDDTLLEYLYKNEKYTNSDIIEKVKTLWKNFMTIGDPTPLITSVIPIIWQPVLSDKQHPTHISDIQVLQLSTELHMSAPPNHQRLLFWDNIYSRFYKSHTPSVEPPEGITYEESDEGLDNND